MRVAIDNVGKDVDEAFDIARLETDLWLSNHNGSDLVEYFRHSTSLGSVEKIEDRTDRVVKESGGDDIWMCDGLEAWYYTLCQQYMATGLGDGDKLGIEELLQVY